MKKDSFVSPLEDFAFKQIFGEQQNIDITRAFLKTLLDVPADEYDKLTIVNPNLGKIFRRGKSGIVDIRLTTKSKKIIHIELQVEKRTNMRNRIIYYSTKQVSDQLKWGDDFKKLHQVISIVICNHVLLEEEESYINDYELRNKHNRSFTDLQKLIILELPKLPETEDGALWPWLRFLMCKKKEEYEMLKKKYPELEKPVKYARKMSLLDRWRDERFHRNLAKIDEECLREQWTLDAQEAERKKWQVIVAEKEKAIARNALAEGYTPESIQKITGLSLDEISKL